MTGLRVLKLTYKHEDITMTTPQNIAQSRWYRAGAQGSILIAALAHCTLLEVIQLESWVDFAFTDTDIRTIAHSFPALEVLQLCQIGVKNLSITRPTVTPSSLLTLNSCCPSLKIFAINSRLDLSPSISVHGFDVFRNLVTVYLGGILFSPEIPPGAATFWVGKFPQWWIDAFARPMSALFNWVEEFIIYHIRYGPEHLGGRNFRGARIWRKDKLVDMLEFMEIMQDVNY